MIDPSTNALLGVIKLGDQAPANLSPLYKGQLLVHGMGFSPDRKTLAAISIGSNSVTFIDTATNAVKHTAYVGRSPHEAWHRSQSVGAEGCLAFFGALIVLARQPVARRLQHIQPDAFELILDLGDGAFR